MTREVLQQALEYIERHAIIDGAPVRDALRAVLAQPVRPTLAALVQKVHKAKGRYHSQIAMCDLYDACNLPNVRPGADVGEAAKALYETWSKQIGYVPWQDGGNSLMQDKAREIMCKELK